MEIQPIQAVTPPTKINPIEKVTEVSENTIRNQTKEHYFQETGNEYTPEELKQLEKKVDELNQQLLGRDTKLQFEIHERTGQTVVRLVDIQTDELVKEIPPTKMLDVIGKIWDDMGIAVDRKG